MVATDDPLVGIRCTWNACDHVVERFGIPIKTYFEMYLRRARTHAISNRQGAAPALRSDRSSERCQQRLRIAVGNGERRNLGESGDFTELQPLGVLGGADTWCQWIARVDRHIHHASTLHSVRGAERTSGIRWSLGITIVARIGINDAANSPVLASQLRLDAAPGLPVARNDDRAFDRNSKTLQLFIIVRSAVIYVNQWRG